MSTISASASQQITIPAGQRLRFLIGGDGIGQLAAVNGSQPQYKLGASEQMIGPFQTDRVFRVTAVRALSYQLQGPPFDQYLSNGNSSVSQDSGGVQYAGGYPLAGALRTDLPRNADLLVGPVQSSTITAAISTTVTASVTPTGTFRTARIQWTNNGASGTAKLNIAANCTNDVEGLVASQSALQRDYQMTMGDAILIVSPTPITRLNFSSDTAISASTHNLTVTFGA